MSNEKQETIADIVAEMREGVVADGWMEQTLREFADRIEAAWKHSVTNCNRFGNAAKMREALEKADAALSLISKSAWFIDANFAVTKAVIEAGNAIEAALAEPPRNCDLYSNFDEAFRAHQKAMDVYPLETNVDYDIWIFDKAKGETK